MIQKEEESNRTWKAKYDPWLINGYQQVIVIVINHSQQISPRCMTMYLKCAINQVRFM